MTFRLPAPLKRPSFLVLLLALAVGMSACDSGGSDMDDDNDDDNQNEIEQTFTVTVEETTSSYPYDDQNELGVAFAIDGEVGKVLDLTRGATYAFELQSSVENGPEGFPHPFYVDRTAEGQLADVYSSGVENGQAVSGTVTFTVPSSAPDSLFYECGNHVYMGGKMIISGS